MTKLKVICVRFFRAFVAGALASGGAVVGVIFMNTHTWPDFVTAMSILGLSLTIGGITGVLQAGDKLLRWEE